MGITLLIAVAGCTGSDAAPQDFSQTGQTPADQGSGSEPIAVAADTGFDAAVGAPADAGTEPVAPADAAPNVFPDAIAMSPDAGGQPMDAGEPPVDASAPSADASAPPAADATTSPADAGDLPDASGSDAGADSGDPPDLSTFTFDSTEEWAASGVQVMAGACYVVSAQIDDQWLDLDVPADLDGWLDEGDVRAAFFAPLRRVRDDDIGFYQLAACVDQDLAQCFAIGSGATICPEVGGELFFFVNDVPGFEDNNVGTATITVESSG